LKKVLVTLLGFSVPPQSFGAPSRDSAPPAEIRRQGNCAPVRYAPTCKWQLEFSCAAKR